MTCRQDRSAELANVLTHGAGFVASVVVLPVLVVLAARGGDPFRIVGAAVFGTTLVTLYLASTLFHASRHPRVRRGLEIFDHCAIYLLIAGTYTPFTLGVLKGGWGWTLFGIVWAAAALGVAIKVFAGVRRPLLSTGLYLVMGWLVLVAVGPLVQALPPAGLAWLVAGGVAYSAGVPFYLARRMRYGHAIWHLFVLAGSVCHVVAALGWAAA